MGGGEPVAITIKPERTNRVDDTARDRPPNSVREQAQRIEMSARAERRPPPRTSSIDSTKEKSEDQCYVKNSSFLSRDIEAQKSKVEVTLTAVKRVESGSPPIKEVPSPPRKEIMSPPKKETASPPKRETVSPPKPNRTSPPKAEIVLPSKSEIVSPPKKEITSPPTSAFKIGRNNSKSEENSFVLRTTKKDNSKDTSTKNEKILQATSNDGSLDKVDVDRSSDTNITNSNKTEEVNGAGDAKNEKNEESNGVGDKIKKFEKAAEDASASVGRSSRPGSVRGRSRSERLGSDGKEDLPPPATPFKDNVHFDLSASTNLDKTIECQPSQQVNNTVSVERQQSITKNSSPNLAGVKWQKSGDSHSDEADKIVKKPEPQKIIKPEFKPMPSPVDVTIRSPSLGAKIADQFPSHGTAFRNVASPDATRCNREAHRFNDDINTQNNFKTCKFKTKEKYSVSKGSSYFTRGSEEIWLVKKKDIEEIEERVLDSFRRAGGNICMRSESMRPSSDSGQTVSFSHATMGRNKRQMYSRSESLDPQWAGTRAQTLKRQSSVACTCGHDKKTRAKSAGAEVTPRPRSRSHGDDNNQSHVLDKYETLV